MAKAKLCITSPPKSHKIITTTKVVSEVMIVLDNDSLMLLLTTDVYESRFDDFRFSRILSKITIVSLSEYPTIVRNAAMIGRLISYERSEKIPSVINTSCVRAAMAPSANLNSKRIEIYNRMRAKAEKIASRLFR